LKMNKQGGVVGLTIEQPIDVALRTLRKALTLEGLHIPHEIDTAGSHTAGTWCRAEAERGSVYRDPIRLLEATVMNPAGGLFVPEPGWRSLVSFGGWTRPR
jgi:hypothetical protein